LNYPSGSDNVYYNDSLKINEYGAIEITGDIIPSEDLAYNLGSTGMRWQDAYFGTGSVYIGDVKLSSTGTTLIINDQPIIQTAGVRYVATNGSDSNDGSVNSPFLTIQRALDTIPTDNTTWNIYIAPGDYAITDTANGFNITKSVTISGLGDQGININGFFRVYAVTSGTVSINNLTIVNNAFNYGCINIVESTCDLSCKNVEMQLGFSDGTPLGVINNTSASNIYLDNVTILSDSSPNAIPCIGCNQGNLTILNSHLETTADYAIYYTGSGNVSADNSSMKSLSKILYIDNPNI
jgi:hypothetical protein